MGSAQQQSATGQALQLPAAVSAAGGMGKPSLVSRPAIDPVSSPSAALSSLHDFTQQVLTYEYQNPHSHWQKLTELEYAIYRILQAIAAIEPREYAVTYKQYQEDNNLLERELAKPLEVIVGGNVYSEMPRYSSDQSSCIGEDKDDQGDDDNDDNDDMTSKKRKRALTASSSESQNPLHQKQRLDTEPGINTEPSRLKSEGFTKLYSTITLNPIFDMIRKVEIRVEDEKEEILYDSLHVLLIFYQQMKKQGESNLKQEISTENPPAFKHPSSSEPAKDQAQVGSASQTQTHQTHSSRLSPQETQSQSSVNAGSVAVDSFGRSYYAPAYQQAPAGSSDSANFFAQSQGQTLQDRVQNPSNPETTPFSATHQEPDGYYGGVGVDPSLTKPEINANVGVDSNTSSKPESHNVNDSSSSSSIAQGNDPVPITGSFAAPASASEPQFQSKDPLHHHAAPMLHPHMVQQPYTATTLTMPYGAPTAAYTDFSPNVGTGAPQPQYGGYGMYPPQMGMPVGGQQLMAQGLPSGMVYVPVHQTVQTPGPPSADQQGQQNVYTDGRYMYQM